MTPEERQLLNALADRVKNVPSQRKDLEAEQFLRNLVQERPDTPYILAQTVIMQDFALRNAQKQIEDLQRQLSEASQTPQESGSFLGGLFGGGSQSPQPPAPSAGSVPRVNPLERPAPAPTPQGYGPANQGYGYGGPQGGPQMQPSQTGDFLRSAASTAAGVAGGALLFQGISSLFSGHHGGLLGGDHSGGTPRESLTETTVVNNYGDDKGGAAGESQHLGNDAGGGSNVRGGLLDADYDGNSDGDLDFGGGDDYA